MNALTGHDAGTGGGPALARLDGDGAPPAVSRPETATSTPCADLAGLPGPRLQFDLARARHGAVDGAWWPRSRNARSELAGLIAGLKEQGGVRVQRLAIDRGDWDDIPHRLTEDQGHVVRVDWFTTIPAHTVSVSAAGRVPISLLVVPPGTPARAARASMNLAVTRPGTA